MISLTRSPEAVMVRFRRGAFASARILGAEAGKAAGSWVPVNDDNAADIIAADDDGELIDIIGMPSPLSGEWADGLTLRELAVDCGFNDDDPDALALTDPDTGAEIFAESFTFETCMSIFEQAYADAYVAEVLDTARYYIEA